MRGKADEAIPKPSPRDEEIAAEFCATGFTLDHRHHRLLARIIDQHQLAKIIASVRREERERCAKIADAEEADWVTAFSIAEKIRNG
jgi:hypothetical protein